MSYGIVRVQKISSGSVKGIEIHDRREKDGISHTNKDIDWERTKENYDLHTDQNSNFNKAVKERIRELNLPKAVRKDAVVMVQVLVTSDHDFFKGLSKGQQEQFFKDSYNFLAGRYGKENVVSATVHLDERTSHMHFNFVPVTNDGRLSAKSILTRQSLIEQQTAFYEQVGRYYELERGLQGGKKKHLEIAELKAQTALESAFKAQERAQGIQDSIKPLQAEYEACKAYVRECDKESQVSMSMPSYAVVKEKGFFKKQEYVTIPKEKWIKKHISANEKEYLKMATMEFEKAVADFSKTTSAEHFLQLEQKINILEHSVAGLQKENHTLKIKLISTKDDTDKIFNKINYVLGKLPNDISNAFIQAWEEPKREQSYDCDMER